MSAKYMQHGPPAPNFDAEVGDAAANIKVGTSETSVRLGFLRKVYSILTLQLMVTVLISLIFGLVKPIRLYAVSNPWLLFAGLALGIGTYIPLVCCKQRSPINGILLGLFVLGFSVMVGVIVGRYFHVGWGLVVLQAFCATLATFLGITVFILITKKDFSYLGGFLFGAVLVLLVLALVNFATVWVSGYSKMNRWLSFGISVLGALIMIGYLLYDTSLIVNRYGPDDWLLAVVSLYIDVVSLFLYMLSIMSFANSA